MSEFGGGSGVLQKIRDATLSDIPDMCAVDPMAIHKESSKPAAGHVAALNFSSTGKKNGDV
jgi:hypothetical protein